MKKISLLVVTLLSVFIMASCDHSDNTLDSLDRNYIPNKVTQSFNLQKGKDNNFIWTSSNEGVIKIEESKAIVTQMADDVLVTLTVSVADKKENFNILVLKDGEALSPFEKAQEFMKHHNEILIDFEGLYLSKKIDNLYLSFDDNHNDNNSTPTYSEEFDYIYIRHLDLEYRYLNIYFNEMIDDELVRVHENTIKLIYQNEEDLFYRQRPFKTYLEDGIDKLHITNNTELDDYIKTLDPNLVDELYITYLNGLKDRNYLLYNGSLLLIRNMQPTSNNEVRIGNINIKEGNLIVELNTHQGINNAVRFWDFVIEVDIVYSVVDDVIVNVNYVDEEKLYLNAFTYNFDYLDALEERIIVIDSLIGLENYIDFINENNNYYEDGHKNTVYYNHLLKYDELYFNDNKLILINYNAGSGSFKYTYKDFKVVGRELIINIKSNNPQIGTADIKPWNFIIEVNNLLEFDEVNFKFDTNGFNYYPIITRPLKTITFGDDSYNYEGVYRPVGNLFEHQEELKSKYNIDLNKEMVVIESSEAFKEIYEILMSNEYEGIDASDKFVWLLVNRQAGGSHYISVEYSYYDEFIGYEYPYGSEAGDTAMFNVLDIIRIPKDIYELLTYRGRKIELINMEIAYTR